MLISVDVSNNRGGFVTLPLQDSSSGIVVKDIAGLDPVKATLVTSSFANLDGAQYHDSRRDARNVVMTLGLDPQFLDMSVQAIRRKLYNVMMPKSNVTLTFHTDDLPPITASGWVESCEAPLFTQDPELQVSILCMDPDFIDNGEVVVTGTSVVDDTTTHIYYDGTVDTGVLLALKASATTGVNGIYNYSPGNDAQVMSVQLVFAANDVFTVSTIQGNKFATLNQGGYEKSALQNVSPFSAWIKLVPGDNYLRVAHTGVNAATWELHYFNRYGGL